MLNIQSFEDFLSESSDNHAYELHYTSSNVRGVFKGNNTEKLIDQVEALKGVSEWSLFRNSSGFNSTADEKYLVKWWDKGGDYWSNRSKKEPELLKKKYDKK